MILPLTALIIGTSVLGAEIDDGSIVHLLATPVRRSSVIVTKFAVGAVLTMAFVAVPELVAGLIATGGTFGKLAIGLFVGALAGSVIYNAVFVMLSVLTTRAIAVGLLYVLIWEAVLGNFVSGARLLSVGQYSLGVANGIAHDSALNAGLTLTTALIMGVDRDRGSPGLRVPAAVGVLAQGRRGLTAGGVRAQRWRGSRRLFSVDGTMAGFMADESSGQEGAAGVAPAGRGDAATGRDRPVPRPSPRTCPAGPGDGRRPGHRRGRGAGRLRAAAPRLARPAPAVEAAWPTCGPAC